MEPRALRQWQLLHDAVRTENGPGIAGLVRNYRSALSLSHYTHLILDWSDSTISCPIYLVRNVADRAESAGRGLVHDAVSFFFRLTIVPQVLNEEVWQHEQNAQMEKSGKQMKRKKRSPSSAATQQLFCTSAENYVQFSTAVGSISKQI